MNLFSNFKKNRTVFQNLENCNKSTPQQVYFIHKLCQLGFAQDVMRSFVDGRRSLWIFNLFAMPPCLALICARWNQLGILNSRRFTRHRVQAARPDTQKYLVNDNNTARKDNNSKKFKIFSVISLLIADVELVICLRAPHTRPGERFNKLLTELDRLCFCFIAFNLASCHYAVI